MEVVPLQSNIQNVFLQFTNVHYLYWKSVFSWWRQNFFNFNQSDDISYNVI